MQTTSEQETGTRRLRLPIWAGLCLFLAIAVFFLWGEHKAHILGVLPWALLLACPLIHLFMHGGHGGHGAGHTSHEGHRDPNGPGGGAS